MNEWKKKRIVQSQTRAMGSYHILYLFIYMYALITFEISFGTIPWTTWYLRNGISSAKLPFNVTAWFLLIWAKIVTSIEFHARHTYTHIYTHCTNKVHAFIKLRYANINMESKFNMLICVICAISYDAYYNEKLLSHFDLNSFHWEKINI